MEAPTVMEESERPGVTPGAWRGLAMVVAMAAVIAGAFGLVTLAGWWLR